MELRPRRDQDDLQQPQQAPLAEVPEVMDDQQGLGDQNQVNGHANQQLLQDQAQLVLRNLAPAQYVKSLSSFKHGSDLLIFLQRFRAYCQALQVPVAMMPSLLVAHLDDSALRGIARHLNQDLTYDEIVDILKKAEGYHENNTDRHITEMAARKRLRNEKVHDYFVDLARMAELAYPRDNQFEIKEQNLRQDFIRGINHPHIAARLRERPDMDLDQLVDWAVLLESCYESSKVPSTSFNNVSELEPATSSTSDAMLNQIVVNLERMVEKLVLNQIESPQRSSQQEDNRDNYHGSMTPEAWRRDYNHRNTDSVDNY